MLNNKMYRGFWIALSMIHCPLSVSFAQTPVYLDETKPIEQRIEDALSRMTLDEKIAVIHAQSKFSSPGVKRLGLPDFYDADGVGSGGTNLTHPMTWSVMASGFKNNNGRNPAGYSLFERYALGFAQPVLIEGEGTITVPALEKSNTGYRLNTANEGEYFIIENRQRVKWDKNLAGPGMLIWRVDSTNVEVWENNLVNANPNHNYYELLRANFNGMNDSPRDPFPGTTNVTSITNATQPSLRTWDGKLSHYALMNIAEADSIITFDVIIDKSKSSIEDFEKMPVGATLNERGVAGVYANWDFYNCAVVDTAQVGNGHVVAMRNGSYINTAENLNKIPGLNELVKQFLDLIKRVGMLEAVKSIL